MEKPATRAGRCGLDAEMAALPLARSLSGEGISMLDETSEDDHLQGVRQKCEGGAHREIFQMAQKRNRSISAIRTDHSRIRESYATLYGLIAYRRNPPEQPLRAAPVVSLSREQGHLVRVHAPMPPIETARAGSRKAARLSGRCGAGGQNKARFLCRFGLFGGGFTGQSAFRCNSVENGVHLFGCWLFESRFTLFRSPDHA